MATGITAASGRRPKVGMNAPGTLAVALPGITFRPLPRFTREMHEATPAAAPDEPAGFRELVLAHSRMVFRLACRITGNEADAEDVVQETFWKAYRAFERFDSRASVSTWLYRIASNCAIDLLRRRRARPETAFADEASDAELPASSHPTPQANLLSREAGRQLAAALDELTPRERAAFALRHEEGVPIRDIGAILGLSANAAKQTVFRAVRKLRQRLAPLRENLT